MISMYKNNIFLLIFFFGLDVLIFDSGLGKDVCDFEVRVFVLILFFVFQLYFIDKLLVFVLNGLYYFFGFLVVSNFFQLVELVVNKFVIY